MNIWIYLAIAMVIVKTDAICCFIAKVKFKLFSSILVSLLWPITVFLVIGDIVREQKKNDMHFSDRQK